MRIEEAAHLLAAGKVATVDVGEFIAQDRRSDFFMHAAAIGLNVAFARIATQASRVLAGDAIACLASGLPPRSLDLLGA
jgi:diacylglycerol kinase family enzyme